MEDRKMSVDLLYKGQGQGPVAQQVLNAGGRLNAGSMKPFIAEDGNSYISVFKGGDPKKIENYSVQLTTNAATLRRDEWKTLDEAILNISEYRLGGVQDLVDSGLVFNLGNGMGTTVFEWHDVSDALEAVATMDGVNRGNNDRPVYQTNYLPLPIIHADYEINARVLASSRSLGNPLDTTMAERAARKVNVFLENMLFTNTTYSWGETDDRSRNTIYSYINHPDRNLVTLSTYGNWDASATTGADIVNSVLAMKQASIDDYHYGPWKLYIPTAYETVLDSDYDTTTPGTTIRERILKIGQITGIKVIDTLPANNVLLVQLTSDVVRLVRGMGMQNVEWKSEGNLLTTYKVMTIQVPQIRSDQNSRSGIVHMS
jgi:hypothetical protein